MKKKENPIVGIDIGTTKICTIIGERINGTIEIIGMGFQPSQGLRSGMVINIDSTVESIKRSVEDAEKMANCDIHNVTTGIAGGHILGFNSHGVIGIKTKEVTKSDVRRVLDQAKTIAIPPDREILHVLPQEFIVDNQYGIKDPIGIAGVRLEVKVHIVTGVVTSIQNIYKCTQKNRLTVTEIVLEQLASSEAVLTPDEKEIGVALIDIGGGTTDVAIFLNGVIKHTCVLPVGGRQLTNDIAFVFRTPLEDAEKIKKEFGCGYPPMVRENDTIQFPSVGGRETRTLSRKILSEVIEARIEEIFSQVQRELIKSGYEDLIASGLVLTGGTALLPGIVETAERVCCLPIRIGYPKHIGGLSEVVNSPMYATGVGLLLHENKNTYTEIETNGNKFFTRLGTKAKNWLFDIL